MKKTICFDLDGVITDYKSWKKRKILTESDAIIYTKGIANLFRKLKPIKGVKDFIKKLIKEYTIIIYTARGEHFRKLTEDWLNLYKIPYNRLIMNKPMAHIYIDDLGMAFKATRWTAHYRRRLVEELNENG